MSFVGENDLRVLLIGVPVQAFPEAVRLATRYIRNDWTGRKAGRGNCIVYQTGDGIYAVWHSARQVSVRLSP